MAGKVTTSKLPNKFEDAIKDTPFAGKTEEQVKNLLYSQSLQALRNEHLSEFQTLVSAAYAAYGLTYHKRLTEEEKAEQQVAALLAAHPGLAAKFAPGQDEDVEVSDIV